MANGFKPVARNFINFDQYLAQNDPSQLVEQTTGELGKKAGQLQGDISKAQTGFTEKALQGTGGVVSQGGILSPGGFNAYGRPKSETEARNITGTTYTGPRTLAEAMGRDVSNEVGDVASRVRGLQTPEGRMAMLQEQQKNQPGYTRGMAAYDAALLGGSQQGAQALGGLQEKYGKLDTFLGGAQKQAETTAGNVERALGGAKTAAQDFLGRAEATRQSDADRAAAQTNRTTAENAAVSEADRNLARWAQGRERIDDTDAVKAWFQTPMSRNAQGKQVFGPEFDQWYRDYKKQQATNKLLGQG